MLMVIWFDSVLEQLVLSIIKASDLILVGTFAVDTAAWWYHYQLIITIDEHVGGRK
jgi:hypothetical protein